MWDKVKFLMLTWAYVIVAYLMITVMMPFFVDMADIAADSVDDSPHAATYVGGSEAADYAPWFVYLTPAVAGVVLTILKLKEKI